MAKLTLKLTLSVILLSFGSLPAFSQTIGETQKIIRSSDQIAADMIAREMIEKKKISPVVDKNIAAQQNLEAGPKSLIKNIAVTGVTLLKQEEINKITREYENQELNIRQMQKITDLITGLYRIKGFITSRAYLPPQKLEGGDLEIRVLEGITGNVQIRGNRYFKTALVRNKLVYLKKGEPFNYEALRKGLVKINEHPDRNAKAYLMPGQEAGTTDIDIEVKDNLPIHVGFDWDNYGSRYINKNRYRLTLTDNNLFGWDDILTLQYQVARGENYVFLNGRYLLPVTPTWKLGFFAARSAVKLRKDFEDLNVRGKSRLYSIYGIKSLVEEQDINLNLNFGFDYKDVFNFQTGDEISRDRLRILKAGWDLDTSDSMGRTIFTNDLNYGLSDFMGGLQKRDPDHASRDGAGGKFVKDTVNLLRLQRMPYDSALLWKNQLQFSPYILTATEQFQIGGIANVRGYPPAELVGDQGYSTTWEWSFPPYLMPKDFKVPFMQANFYEALRLVFFYDWANTRLRRPAAGEQKDRTLRSVGTGLRLNLPNDFSARLEFAWPLDNTPSDGSHLHIWTEISKSF